MIPTHYKILAVLLVVGAMLTGAFLFGVDYQKGKQAKQEKKIIITQVEDHNEDIISLEEHSRDIAKLEKQFEASLRAIPRVKPSPDCPVLDYERMYNETITTVNSVRVED